MIISSFKEVGPPSTPQEIKRLRREVMDMSRKMGQPVVFRHMWNLEDVERGWAKRCPACWNDEYNQARNDCPVCFGFGFASTEFSINQNMWITQEGQFYETASPEADWVRAPRYGGFTGSILTWLMEPDVAVDVFRINEEGIMMRTFDAQGIAPWFPHLSDNDLCINVTLSQNDYSIISTGARWQLKQVQQLTVRGFGKRGRPQGTQAFKVGQTFQMSHTPTQTSIFDVPVDVA